MNNLKGIEKLEKVINNFLVPFGLTGSFDTDFSYYYGEDKVTFSLIIPKYANQYFQEFVNSIGADIEVDIFLVSLLHEVGHSETYDDLDDMEIAYSDDIKAEIREELFAGVTEDRKKQLYFKYFNLPDERAATEWAIEYLKANAVQITLDWLIISDAIVDFYKTNLIDFN